MKKKLLDKALVSGKITVLCPACGLPSRVIRQTKTGQFNRCLAGDIFYITGYHCLGDVVNIGQSIMKAKAKNEQTS